MLQTQFLAVDPVLVAAFAAVLVLTALLADYARMLWMRRRLPPGPFPWPIVGNHFQTPATRPWITWEKWAQYYRTPMLTIWIGRHPRIILCDAWVASDLLEKRSDIFSSRPRLIVMGDAINTTTTNQTVLPYGDRWRVHRKLMHAAVGSQAIRNYRSFQADESKLLIRDLMVDPNDFELSIERYSVSTTSIVGWGRRINSKNDYVAQQALKMMEAVNFVVPGVFLMEAIPAMLQLPAWLYSLPHTLHMGSAIIARYFYMLTEESLGTRCGQEAFGKYMLDEQKKMEEKKEKNKNGQGLSDLEVAGLMGNLIGGGVDTTSSTMLSCILAMACFPDVQRKAQQEMDAVVGRDRSPTWADLDENRLPYLTALVKEVLRWRTVTVLAGIPHANTQPVEYQGYHFQANTNFTGNMWAIHRHPRDFPQPDDFRPERFLDGHADQRPYPNARGSNPFGWGRRQCSGQPLAEQGLRYSLGRMIWAFDILPGLDDQGQNVKLDIFAYTESENTRPEAFKARFVPRSDTIRQLVLEEAAEAREALRIYDGDTKLSVDDAAPNPCLV
ncbi:hypothetical protein SBRCBS47491_006158 [Sporothrix bragantina]|uniref:Cytochrome P450 n=1 Tax=Sporothrix bragantina TaxID=671064 RepID=A0ABP0C2L5_9PEZI